MTTPADLLPCPFCGGTELRVGESPSGLRWVYCWPCHAAKHSYRKDDAIEHWNRRADETILASVRDAERERCAKVCDETKTSGGAGYILIEVAAAIRALPPAPKE